MRTRLTLAAALGTAALLIGPMSPASATPALLTGIDVDVEVEVTTTGDTALVLETGSSEVEDLGLSTFSAESTDWCGDAVVDVDHVSQTITVEAAADGCETELLEVRITADQIDDVAVIADELAQGAAVSAHWVGGTLCLTWKARAGAAFTGRSVFGFTTAGSKDRAAVISSGWNLHKIDRALWEKAKAEKAKVDKSKDKKSKLEKAKDKKTRATCTGSGWKGAKTDRDCAADKGTSKDKTKDSKDRSWDKSKDKSAKDKRKDRSSRGWSDKKWWEKGWYPCEPRTPVEGSDETVEDEVVEDGTTEDETTEEEIVEDETTEDETTEEEIVEDETTEEETVEEETTEVVTGGEVLPGTTTPTTSAPVTSSPVTTTGGGSTVTVGGQVLESAGAAVPVVAEPTFAG